MKTIRLISGVEASFNLLRGKHQRILTENEGRNFKDAINEVLAELVVNIGDISKPNAKFFDEEILFKDKSKLLVELRMASMNDNAQFSFDYKYTGNDGEKKTEEVDVMIQHKKLVEVDGVEVEEWVPGCFEKPYHTTWSSYLGMDKTIMCTLPDSGTKVRFNLLDALGMKTAAGLTKKQRSSHTMITIHRPVYQQPKKDTWISLGLDDLSLVDIEALRKAIHNAEAIYDTEVIFQHPETGENVSLDITQQVSFFFPSGVI